MMMVFPLFRTKPSGKSGDVILCDPVDEVLSRAVTLLHSTTYNIPEDFNLRQYHCENLKFRVEEKMCPPRQANEMRAGA